MNFTERKISNYLLIMHSMVWEVQAGVPSVWKKINCIRNRLHLPGRFSEPRRNRWQSGPSNTEESKKGREKTEGGNEIQIRQIEA